MKSGHSDFCLRQGFRDPVVDLATEDGTDLVLIVVFITFSAVLFLSHPHPLFIQTLFFPSCFSVRKLLAQNRWASERTREMERQSEKKKKRDGWRLRTYKTKKSWMTRRGERTQKQEQKEKQGWRRPEKGGGANNYRSSHVFKALLLSPLPVNKKKRGRAERGKMRRGRLTSRQL